MTKKIRLFDASVKIPMPTRAQILAKIDISQGIPGVGKIRAHVLSVVQQALKSSGVAADYIGYLLHQPDFSIRIIWPDQRPEYLPSVMRGYISRHYTNGTVTFIYNENLADTLTTSTILHECWHGFWKQLFHLPDLDKVKCPTLDNRGSPLPDWDFPVVERFREQLASYYARVRQLYIKLDTGKGVLTVDEHQLVDAIPQTLPIKPYPMDATVGELVAKYGNEWVGATTRLHFRVAGERGGKALIYIACSEDSKACRAQQVLGDLLHSLAKYERLWQCSLGERVVKQFTSGELKVFRALRKSDFNALDFLQNGSLGNSSELLSKLGSGPENDAIIRALIHKCQYITLVAWEADTFIREYPFLSEWNETGVILQHRRDNVQRWKECSPDKFFAHIPASVPAQEPRLLQRNACVQSVTPEYLQTGIQSLVVSFLMSAVDLRMRQHRPKLAAAILNGFKLLMLLALLYDEQYNGLMFTLAGEASDYLGFKTVGAGLQMAGLFAENDADDYGLSPAIAIGAGMIGQGAGCIAFKK
ncbi:MAG: hypothetical protein K0U29_08180 [Gammaproteobacteria bacterium]|nr:hypothetical protein [Gammaproteobacteria bacterium]